MEAVLVAARLLEFGGALVLCGAPPFYLYGIGCGGSHALRFPWQGALVRVAAWTALAGTIAWVMAETASFSENWRDAFDPSSLWTVLGGTRFGQACLLRIAFLVASLVVAAVVRRASLLWIVQSTLGLAVAASFAWTGHGAMGEGAAGAAHLAADLLHLWTAGIWIGALLPLCMMLWGTAVQEGAALRGIATALARFSAIGPAVIALLALSGAINVWYLIGPHRWPSLFGGGYGRTLLVKLGVFGAMLVLAAFNRLRLAPGLNSAVGTQVSAARALARLRMTLLGEVLLALAVVLAVSLLGTLAPPIADE